MIEKKQLTPVQRFIDLLLLDRKDIYYILIYATAGGLITLSLPLGIQAIVGLIAGGSISSSWGVLIFIVTAGTAMTGVLKVMQLSVTETLQRRIFVRSSFDFADRLPKLPVDSTNRIHLPELANRFFDTLSIQKGLPKILTDMFEAVLQIVFGLLLISLYHPLFIFFGLVLIFILYIIFKLTAPIGLETSIKESKYKYGVAHWLEELARTMTTFKLSGDSPLPLQKTDALVSGYLDSRKKHFKILLWQFGSMIIFKVIITAALLIIGSILVIENQINLGQFIASEIVIIMVMSSVEKLIISIETVYDVLTAIEKLGAVTDMEMERESGLDFSKCLIPNKGIELGLQNVGFQFIDSTKPTLSNINLHIEAGQKVCIAGHNASGRSTLIQIIACLLKKNKGVVTYNGMPRASLELKSLRKAIGDFSEGEDIFAGTILDNISLGVETTDIQSVIRAAKAIGVHDTINSFPEGYNTVLMPSGKNISSSLASKIILTRCVVTSPQLLALEDYSKHIEREDRHQITKFLTDKNQTWTVLAVSNDIDFAKQCDRVIIMNDGKIVADGTFDEVKKLDIAGLIFDK
jgi:ABC-type bacteriocin/lantibiotic exporter with double-glycine peptidase domain